MHHNQMFVLLPVLALLVPISSAEDFETPLNDRETFETLNSMYTNDLVWSDEWAKKALDWAKSPEYTESVDPDLVVGGRRLIVNANDKPVWQKILDALESQFDGAETELEQLPPGTIYGCNGYMGTRETKNDYVTAVCLYEKQ